LADVPKLKRLPRLLAKDAVSANPSCSFSTGCGVVVPLYDEETVYCGKAVDWNFFFG